MSQQNPKLVMMRFDPRAGWVQPSEERIEVDEDEAQVRQPKASSQAPSANPAPHLREVPPPPASATAPALSAMNERDHPICQIFKPQQRATNTGVN